MKCVISLKQEDSFLYCGPEMEHFNFSNFNFWKYGS